MKIVVIGGSNIDYNATALHSLTPHNSNIGKLEVSYGGVGRNIVENLARLDNVVTFLTVIGNDANGKEMLNELVDLNVRVISPFVNETSSSYISVNNELGDMSVAICDSSIMKHLDSKFIDRYDYCFEDAEYILMDGNIEQETIDYIFERYSDKKIIVESTSIEKAQKFKNRLDEIYLMKFNKLEFESFGCIKNLPLNYIITNSSNNVIVHEENSDYEIEVNKIDDIINSNGAGDALLAATIHILINNGSLKEGVSLGIKAAELTLKSKTSVSKEISSLLGD